MLKNEELIIDPSEDEYLPSALGNDPSVNRCPLHTCQKTGK